LDHLAVIFRFIFGPGETAGMAFREVLVTQVKEVLRAWLAGAGKRPAARRADVDVKTAMRYIKAARAAGLVRDGDQSQLTDELLGAVVPYRTLARFAAAECGYSSCSQRAVTAPVADGKPGEEVLCGNPHSTSYAAPGNMRRRDRRGGDCRWSGWWVCLSGSA
jgi:hypothetical protein